MKKKEPRYYLLWFVTAGMWTITFLSNLSSRSVVSVEGWVLVIQFLNIWVSLAAGVVNARRYRKKQQENEGEN